MSLIEEIFSSVKEAMPPLKLKKISFKSMNSVQDQNRKGKGYPNSSPKFLTYCCTVFYRFFFQYIVAKGLDRRYKNINNHVIHTASPNLPHNSSSPKAGINLDTALANIKILFNEVPQTKQLAKYLNICG